MNNKPVAWTDGRGNYFDKHSFFPVDDLTPLYTHPVKELTDDEVEEFEWVLKKHFNFPTNEIVPNLDKIIRAILRKAQEK